MNALTSALIGLVAGVVLGLALYRVLPPGRSQQQLRRERDEARRALERYRQQVDEHFVQSAEAIAELDRALQSVQTRLASGAHRLCSDDGRRMALARAVEVLPEDEADVLPDGLHAPLDYAPEAKGTLAENFGLNDSSDSEELAGFDLPDEPPAPRVPPRDYAEGADECEDSPTPASSTSSRH